VNFEQFLDLVLDKKRTAEAHGMRLDIMVLHRDFHDALMKSIGQHKGVSNAFELRQCAKEPERHDIFLHGVKVMWSGGRLPVNQVWYRYSNPNFKKKL
jgi:hypothetical protein